MIKVTWVRSFSENEKYGGSFYNKSAYSILKKNFDFKFYDVFNPNLKNYFFSLIFTIFNSFKINGTSDIWIRDYFSSISLFLFQPKIKNVVYIQHIASVSKNKFINLLFIIYNFIFYFSVKKSNAVITISQFWKNHFLKKGIKNVFVIYPFLEFEKFNISNKDIEEFKIKYGISDKPIIYLGNCRLYKGVVESYEALKDLDVYLVTSGEEEVKIPCRNFNLEYKEYLCLLKASSVVLFMSKFEEGWGLTAHEAMYLKTPVIGSGMGGSKELLEGGGQIISDFKNLKENVLRIISNTQYHNELGQKGHNYAKQFSKELFDKTWVYVLNEIHKNY